MLIQTLGVELEDVINQEIEPGLIEETLKKLPEQMLTFGLKVVLAILIFVIGGRLIGVIRKIIRKSLTRAGSDAGVIQFLDSFIKITLYIVIVFLIAGGFGVDATSAAAVLGSAGVAIGLALQGSLSNLAGGILILILKPFRVGDYIIEDNKKNEGTVSEIQIFYTKLITPDDKVIVLPNGALANNSLTNVTTTDNRRLDLTVGISYSSDLQRAKQILASILDEEASVIQTLDQNIFVDELGSSAVMLGIRCYVKNEDYLATKWHILETIKYMFEENDIQIPYQKLDVNLISEQ
ncbi:MAG: mechanosensitive ion channel [Lachnospiraceae bacterium]|nr:mechanosensitive ion channel [Lachnospiraceae bacterium]MDD3660411.1 mechanosensitive ion channel [Lachnospiraceae bacterium]